MRYFFFLVILVAGGTALAASFDAPKRKSGLWEIKVSSGQAKNVHSMQQCIDEKTDDLMKRDMGEIQKPQCSKNEMRKEGDKIVVDSVCKMQNSTATTHAVFTGRFDTAYRADIKSSYEPPMAGMKDSSSVIEGKWLGPCSPGQKPGDVVIPGMPNINIDEMKKRALKGQ